MDKDKTLEKIRESIEDAIKPILKKGESMTPADLESLTKAVCVIEKIKRIEEGNSYDDGGYSMHAYGYPENNSYDDNGNSYRRGRSPTTGRYVSRDAMPVYHGARYYDGGTFTHHNDGNVPARSYDEGNHSRYYNEGASTRRYYDANNHNGYSGHSIQDRMIDQLERMIDEAKTEHERQTVKDWIRRLRD